MIHIKERATESNNHIPSALELDPLCLPTDANKANNEGVLLEN
jgi:hypothetical protein